MWEAKQGVGLCNADTLETKIKDFQGCQSVLKQLNAI